MKIGALLFLLLGPPAWSQYNPTASQSPDPYRDVINSFENFERAQKAMQNMSSPLFGGTGGSIGYGYGYCRDCKGPTVGADERLSCFKKICANSNQSLFQIEEKALNAPEDADSKELTKQFEQIFDAKWNGNQREYLAMAESLKNSAPLAGISKAKLGIFYAIGQMTKMDLTADADGPLKMKIKVDPFSSRMKMNVSEAEMKWLTVIAEDIQNRLFQDTHQVISYPSSIYLKLRHPGLNARAAFLEEVKVTEKIMLQLSQNSEFKTTLKSIGLPERTVSFDADTYRNLTDPTNEQLRDLISTRSSFLLVGELIDENSELSRKASSFDPKNLLSAENRQARLQEVNKDLSYMMDDKNKAKQKKLFVSECVARFSYAKNTLPSSAEIEIARASSKNVIEQVKKNVLGQFSESTRSAAEPELSKTNFVFPSPREKFVADYKFDTKDQLHDAMDQAKTSNSLMPFLALIPQKSAEKVTKRHCPESGTRMLSDAAYTNNDGILVSWGSVRGAKMGKRVMAHELGHRLNNIFGKIQMSEHSAKLYSDLKNCIRSKNPSYTMKNTKLSIAAPLPRQPLTMELAEGQTTEEDWADWVSAEAFPNELENPWCGFINKDEAGQANLSLYNMDPMATHSSDYFRIIAFELQKKGKLPPGCKKAVDEEMPHLTSTPACTIPAR